MVVTSMAAPEEEPDSLSKAMARQKVREIAAASDNVFYSRHAEQRMLERDVTTRHVMNVLRRGQVYEEPLFNLEHQNWEVVVVSRTAGAEVEVVVGIDWPSKLVVVTAIRKRN